ncbi:hypothetical protein [Nostoc sp.]|uniref:hypothetical protein n=1 Tax=Nostoc sp. TaxID=1180 RepID=UPI002FF6B249
MVKSIDIFNRLREQEIQIGVIPKQEDRWLTIDKYVNGCINVSSTDRKAQKAL